MASRGEDRITKAALAGDQRSNSHHAGFASDPRIHTRILINDPRGPPASHFASQKKKNHPSLGGIPPALLAEMEMEVFTCLLG